MYDLGEYIYIYIMNLIRKGDDIGKIGGRNMNNTNAGLMYKVFKKVKLVKNEYY
jgi:hypothetical protein